MIGEDAQSGKLVWTPVIRYLRDNWLSLTNPLDRVFQRRTGCSFAGTGSQHSPANTML